MESEQHLLKRILNGDELARRELYDRFSAKAMAVCMRFLADEEAARDVLQDSFIKIYTSIGNLKLEREGSLNSWVMQIVVHEAVNYLREKQDKATLMIDLPQEVSEEVPDEEPDVGELPPGVLMELLGKLPEGYRAVINLFVFERRSHKDIAQMLGIQENSSASQFLRAKRMLAKMIEKYREENNIIEEQ